jgi:two-component system chemotaxis response regulator CheY
VQQVNGAHLRFRDAVRTPEIKLHSRSLALALLDVLEDGVDFLLRKLSAQNLAPARLSAGPWKTLADFSASPPNENTDSSDEYLVRSYMESDILVVDDSAAIRKILQRVLRQTGMAIRAIHEAGDGQEALALLAEHPVDLVLTDINMPKMDGLQLLASLKGSAQWRNVPVVMITTEGGETKVAEAVKLGAAGYVRKPFTADQIKEKLVGILEPALPL